MSFTDKQFALYENNILASKTGFASTEDVEFMIQSGARLVFVLRVTALTGTSVTVEVKNGEKTDGLFDTVETLTLTAPGVIRKAVTDFTSLFKVTHTVAGGNADYTIALAVMDNALSSGGSGLATESTLNDVKTLLTALNGYVDGLEGNTDGLETKLDTLNATLTTLNGYVDGLEGFVDGLEGFTDGLEAGQTTGNGHLSTIATNTTGVATAANQATTHTKLEDIKTLLTALNGYVDTLETLIAATNTKLDAANASLDAIEASAASIDTKTPALVSGRTPVDGSGVTQPISAAALPLPAGAATEATLAALRALFNADSSAMTQVPAAVTSTTLLAANANRKGFVLWNTSNTPAFVAFGATASTSAFTIRMAANSFFSPQLPGYKGAISAIWNSTVGDMKVTELT